MILINQQSTYGITPSGDVVNMRTKHVIKSYPNTTGYLMVKIVIDGIKKWVFVHRLVAMHYIPLIEGKPIVNHKDKDITNNDVSNLEWVTFKENARYKRKVNDCIVQDIRTMQLTNSEYCKKYGLSSTYVSQIQNNQRWAK